MGDGVGQQAEPESKGGCFPDTENNLRLPSEWASGAKQRSQVKSSISPQFWRIVIIFMGSVQPRIQYHKWTFSKVWEYSGSAPALVCVQLQSLQIRSAIARLHVVPRLSRCQLSSHSLILLVSSVPSWVGALCSCRYSCFPQACGTLAFYQLHGNLLAFPQRRKKTRI